MVGDNMKVVKLIGKAFVLGGFCIVIFYFVLIVLLSIELPDEYETTNSEEYVECIKSVKNAQHHMPKIYELGDYEKILIRTEENFSLLFEVQTVSVVLHYDKNTYTKEKQKVLEKYSFLSETKNSLPDLEANVNGYNIKVVNKNTSNESFYSYPKFFLMIGFNEDEKSIVYMFNYDFDLDSISNLDKYIKKYCF